MKFRFTLFRIRSFLSFVNYIIQITYKIQYKKLTCLSVRSREAAISMRLGRHRYLLKWNSFSSSNNCVLV